MSYISTAWKHIMLQTAVILFALVLIPVMVSAKQSQNGGPIAELEISINSDNKYQGTLRILLEDDIATPITVELPFSIGKNEPTVYGKAVVKVERIGVQFQESLQDHTLLNVYIEDPSTREVRIKFPIEPHRYRAEAGQSEFKLSLKYTQDTYLVLEERPLGGVRWHTLHLRLMRLGPGPQEVLLLSKVIVSWGEGIQFFDANGPSEYVDTISKRITAPGDFFERNTLRINYLPSSPNTTKIFSLSSFALMLLLVGLVPFGLVSISTLMPRRRERIGVSILVWLLAMAVTVGLWIAKVIVTDQLIPVLVVGVATLILVIIYLSQKGTSVSSNVFQESDSLPEHKNEDELSNLSLAELQGLDKVYAKHLSHLLLQRARQGTDVKFETQENIEYLKTERARVQSAIDKISNSAPIADPLQA